MAMRPGGHRVTANAAPRTEGRTVRWARLYDAGTTLLSLGRLSALHRKIVELAGITPGERILDVGCGPGRLAILAGTVAGPAGETCGIDPAPEMVELARRQAGRGRVPGRRSRTSSPSSAVLATRPRGPPRASDR